MLSKNTITYIRSLHQRSVRSEAGIFLVEGRKSIQEFLDSDFSLAEGFFTDEFARTLETEIPYQIITQGELDRISTLSSNDVGVLLVKMREKRDIQTIIKNPTQLLTLVLDHINDPGNLGTIIRIADWYGISTIIASSDTVDCYNPKVIMATMGSFPRVDVLYTDLGDFLTKLPRGTSIYGAYLDGEDIHTKSFAHHGGYLVIGSESHGISPDLEPYITDKITIPRIGHAESLNAGVATGIIVDRMIGKY